MPDDEEMRRVNPFDWKAEFPEIMKAGGFDAVMGNPPYVDIKGLPVADVKYVFRSIQHQITGSTFLPHFWKSLTRYVNPLGSG